MRSCKLADSSLATIKPSGYITAANVREFQAELTATVTEKSASSFLVDMQQVEFLDSAGLMALVSAFRLSQKLNKRFTLCSLPASVQIVFELTQLDKVFEIVASPEALAEESQASRDAA
jgi:anti-sigma B factor antagonist